MLLGASLLVERSVSGRRLFRSLGALHLSTSGPPRRRRLELRSLASSGRPLLENCIASTSIFVVPSYKEPTVDALALSTDEGRVWLREATGSCLESVDPWISEWGNPAPVMGCHPGLNT
jgi:hypothetical protein